jgi:alkanesulfonate monooxygenase SsuD/methylene tetrahydromethanopterin reductase-like flavin-dependent oxidoreductase (luciferase family)
MRYDHPLQFSIVCGQRAPWPELVTRIQEAEALGFHGFNVVDHFYGVLDVMDPTHEAWTVLGGLAMASERIRLGVMVCGNTYRNPVVLLKQAITVDHISKGRVDFGVGAGWLEREHEAYSFDFPSARERVDRFAEALEIWDLLQQNERTNYEGRYYQLLDAPFEPKAVQQPRLPVLIGASLPRMLRLTATHADIWNARGTPDEAQAGNDLLDEQCRKAGRDPAQIVRSVSVGVNLFDSVEAFESGVAAYQAAGFTDFQIPWPRTPEQHATMRQVATGVMPVIHEGHSRS